MNTGYLSGFGNHHATEAVKDTLPIGQNSPQTVKHGLYAEQLSGSAFTRRPRQANLKSWLYRILPCVVHSAYKPYSHPSISKQATAEHNTHTPPNQMRWSPIDYPNSNTHFIDSWQAWLSHGNESMHSGAFIYLYACNTNMENNFFYNADGELLIIPQEGSLNIATEFGNITIKPKEIAVIPRGIRFKVDLLEQRARGYVLENFGSPLELPELGPIGANGLANPRDFLYPKAKYEDISGEYILLSKFMGNMYQQQLKFSPLNVVAWHGNYAPYKYDLTRFNTVNTVSFDHPDPSIFTVLTSQTDTAGVANVDFVIFPERWMVAENTFRPPYYHRNIMSEYMGLIYGTYDAKNDDFLPGGGSLHNTMSPHGPDANAFIQASEAELQPERYKGTLAFMLESRSPWAVCNTALNSKYLDKNYLDCWNNLPKQFSIS